MRFFVYEHVSGGGFTEESLPARILSEGFGMLRTLTADFKAALHHVTITLDSRIAGLNPPITADCVVPVGSLHETQANIRKLSEQADAVYIIAPETDGVLQSLVEMIKQTGAISLNCHADAIAKVSNKPSFYEFVRTLGVALPETRLFSVTDDLKEIAKSVKKSLKFPVVFKPSEGVSCGGVSVVRNEAHVAGAVGKIRGESLGERFLVQELIEGPAVSVSLLSTGNSVVPLSLNSQEVTLETPDFCSSYVGGVVPFDHPRKAEAFEVAEKLVKSVPGLRGYVGMDFVLTNEAAMAIEINPRLTTSYVGFWRIAKFNPAQAIVDAVLKHELPAHVESCGYTRFSKVETPSPTINALQETYVMEDVVSPPFPVLNGASSALIASYGDTTQKATARFREAKKRVRAIITRGR